MPTSLSYQVNVSGSTATFYVNDLNANYQYTYTVTDEDGTSVMQFNYIFENLKNGTYITDVTVFDPADGTSLTESDIFTITAGATVTPVAFSVVNEPEFLQAAYNPVTLSVSKSNYRIGDLFFVEVWTVPITDVHTSSYGNPKTGAKLLRTLKANGTGNGSCVFDVSSSLATVFRHDTVTIPNPLLAIQKDESAYQGYYLKAGYIQYDPQNREVKTYRFESDVKFVLRATQPAKVGGNMTSRYMYQYDGETVKLLSNVPNTAKRNPNESTSLPFFFGVNLDTAEIPQYIRLKADLEFDNGSTEEGYEVGVFQFYTGGLYLIDAKPERLVAHPTYRNIVKYSVYLEYSEDDSYFLPFTESREFVIGEGIQEPVNVMFMNRLGGWDTIQFRRDRLTEIKTKASIFQNSYGSRIYQIDTKTEVTFNSSWLTPMEHEWLKDMMVSPALYIDEEYYRQSDTTYKIDSSVGLFTIEITVSPETEENTIQL